MLNEAQNNVMQAKKEINDMKKVLDEKNKTIKG